MYYVNNKYIASEYVRNKTYYANKIYSIHKNVQRNRKYYIFHKKYTIFIKMYNANENILYYANEKYIAPLYYDDKMHTVNKIYCIHKNT